MVKTTALSDYSDVHFTNVQLAHDIVQHFRPRGICMEPFRGEDAFYRWLPEGSPWCEITNGRDFFDANDKVDWIITNPPFSNLTEIFKHAFYLSENCVFLIPISKYWSSNPRLKLVANYGGLKEIYHVGTGRDIGFDIGFPFAAMHFIRHYSGPIHESHMQQEMT